MAISKEAEALRAGKHPEMIFTISYEANRVFITEPGKAIAENLFWPARRTYKINAAADLDDSLARFITAIRNGIQHSAEGAEGMAPPSATDLKVASARPIQKSEH